MSGNFLLIKIPEINILNKKSMISLFSIAAFLLIYFKLLSVCLSWFLESITVRGSALPTGGLIANIEEKIEERGILFPPLAKNFH